MVGKLVELGVIFSQHHFDYPKTIIGFSIVREGVFLGLVFWLLFAFSSVLKRKWGRKFLIFLFSITLLFQLASTFYFVLTTEPVTVMLLDFSLGEAATIAGDYLVFKPYYLFFPVSVLFFLGTWIRLKKKSFSTKKWGVLALLPLFSLIGVPEKLTITQASVSENNTLYFLQSFRQHFFSASPTEIGEATQQYRANLPQKKWGNFDYPFLHEKSEGSSLAPFFELTDTPPNVVFIIIESLSSPYSGKNADYVSFTPFLDSLSEHSLTFHNFLATAQRTFAVLPSTLASLPHGHRGFTALKNNYPEFYSFPHYLFENGYEGTFFYGGHAAFDNMNAFVTQLGFRHIVDREEYNYEGTSYVTSIDPVPFGIGDKALFENSWETINSRQRGSKLDVYLTLSMHYPFLFENQEYYREKARKIIRSMEYTNESKYIKMKKYTKELSSFLYTDDVIKNFFETYKQHPDYENTIFIILGDHMMSEIPQLDEIEKYRTPCIIYSPLLNRSKQIMAVNSQLDITPSLMRLFETRYGWETSNDVHWLGDDFDTLSTYRNNRTIAFMMNNRTMKDFMTEGYFVDNEVVYKMSDKGLFVEKEKADKPELVELKRAFESLHRNAVFTNKITPSQEIKRVIFSTQQVSNEVIPINAEFISIAQTDITENFNVASIQIEMNISSSEESQHPLLVFSITKETEDTTIVRYWNKIEVAELIQKTSNEDYVLEINHRIINSDLGIEKGDHLSIYFWNVDSKQLEYILSNKKVSLSIDEN